MKKHILIFLATVFSIYLLLNYFYHGYGTKKIIEDSKSMNLYSFVPDMKHKYDEYFGSYTRFSYIEDFKYPQKINYSFDKLGYRNYSYDENSSYDVVIFGDSFFWGCSNDDKHAMSNYIRDNSDISVYSMARFVFQQLHLAYKNNFFNKHKTKIVIVQISEDEILDRTFSSDYGKLVQTSISDFNSSNIIRYEQHNEPLISGALSLANMKASVNNLLYNTSEKLYNKFKLGQIGIYQSNTKLFNNDNLKLLVHDASLKRANKKKQYSKFAQTIKQLSNFFGKQGIQLIFVPTPTSPLVYEKYIDSFNFPNNHTMLIDELEKNSVLYIDALKILKESNQKDLWLYDDPHWGPNAIKLVGDELIKLLNKELKK